MPKLGRIGARGDVADVRELEGFKSARTPIALGDKIHIGQCLLGAQHAGAAAFLVGSIRARIERALDGIAQYAVARERCNVVHRGPDFVEPLVCDFLVKRLEVVELEAVGTIGHFLRRQRLGVCIRKQVELVARLRLPMLVGELLVRKAAVEQVRGLVEQGFDMPESEAHAGFLGIGQVYGDQICRHALLDQICGSGDFGCE